MAEAPKNSPRPLSPHLQIYRWPLGMAMSIMHRASGAALAVGTLMIIWMLLAAAYGPSAWQDFNDFASSGLGQVMLFGWTAALFYHLCNGVRHLIWDTAHLFKLENANRAGLVVLLAAAIMTALFWCAASPWKGE
ncbi:MAG: succinate dehydrogenase, cytochrome b556 subunit [Alphaproteobacteria bacterium]|nr:succinate dehydrogenase, cytochrome b556 subunit [Alphaproteobacteria bacterium]